MSPLERTVGTDRTDTRNGCQISSHARSLPNPLPNALPNMSAVLLPPNPAETDMASGNASRSTSPCSQFTLRLSMGSVSRSVGSSTPQRTAHDRDGRLQRSSRAQTVSEIRLRRRNRNGAAASAKDGFVRVGLGNIVEGRARAVGIHVSYLFASDLRLFDG